MSDCGGRFKTSTDSARGIGSPRNQLKRHSNLYAVDANKYKLSLMKDVNPLTSSAGLEVSDEADSERVLTVMKMANSSARLHGF